MPRLPLRAYTRPGKWTGAVRRRAFRTKVSSGLRLSPELQLELIGGTVGGWLVPPGLLSDSSIVYSVGVGVDVSFDLALIERVGCEVFAFDPTEGSERYLSRLGNPRIHFRRLAIWKEDGELRMYKAADPNHIALSSANLQGTREWVTVSARTLASAMGDLGHSRIDLLKFTADGGEYDVITPELLVAANVGIFAVNLFHTATPKRALRLVSDIVDGGYVAVGSRARGCVSVTFVSEQCLLAAAARGLTRHGVDAR